MRYFFAGLLMLTLTLGCFSNTYATAKTEHSVSMVKNFIQVPLARQNTDYTCGVAALQSILGYYGFDKRLDVLSDAVKPDPENGTGYMNIINYAKSLGFNVTTRTNMSLEELKGYIDKKQPVLVVIQAWDDSKSNYAPNKNEDGHYVVAIGYDDKYFYFMDPSTLGHYTYIPTAEFISRWHDYDSFSNEVLTQVGIIMTKPITSPYNPDEIISLD
ncbi:MAG: C39 family peptidase [Sporomusaceae bacterium]|nr:C39 family peptidase [Sporomusaceae bacterium]